MVKSSEQAFHKGLSTRLNNPLGKGKRPILLHIGNKDGFVKGRLLLFQSKSMKDY
jgi:hypothetical protein